MATYTSADLVSIRTAIASGVRKVTFADGRSTEYQDLDQMLAAEKVIATAITMAATTKSSIVRRRTPYYRSGLR